MILFVTAAVLMALAVALLGPVSVRLARASWVMRAPRSAVVLWQSIGLSAIVSGIGAGLAVAVFRYHAGFAPGVRELVVGLVGGRPLQGLGLPDALGLTLAADLLIVLFFVLASVTARTIRSRARHRRLLNLLARESSQYPGTDLIEDIRPVAYCLPGRRPRIVMSDGALQLLSSRQARAVIEHERGHAHEHHGLVMLPMLGIRRLFAWVPYAGSRRSRLPRFSRCPPTTTRPDGTTPSTWRQRSFSWRRRDVCPVAHSAWLATPSLRRVDRLLLNSRNSKTNSGGHRLHCRHHRRGSTRLDAACLIAARDGLGVSVGNPNWQFDDEDGINLAGPRPRPEALDLTGWMVWTTRMGLRKSVLAVNQRHGPGIDSLPERRSLSTAAASSSDDSRTCA